MGIEIDFKNHLNNMNRNSLKKTSMFGAFNAWTLFIFVPDNGTHDLIKDHLVVF